MCSCIRLSLWIVYGSYWSLNFAKRSMFWQWKIPTKNNSLWKCTDQMSSLTEYTPAYSFLDIIMQDYAKFLRLNIPFFANKPTLNLAVIPYTATNLAKVLGLLENMMCLLYAEKLEIKMHKRTKIFTWGQNHTYYCNLQVIYVYYCWYEFTFYSMCYVLSK